MTRSAIVAIVVFGAACATRPLEIAGGPATPAAPNTPWTAPAAAVPPAETPPPPTYDPGLLQRLTVADAVDIALRNNPNTKISWEQARTAAYDYAASQGRLLPSVSADAGLSASQGSAGNGVHIGLSPSVSLSYLVFDFGGRAATIDAARYAAISADYAHNATIQNTILDVETALFNFLASRALRDADSVTVVEDSVNLASARERHRVGLAQIGDTLQASTALASAKLTLETLVGEVDAARATLMQAMGLPVTTALNIPESTTSDSVQFVASSVDSLLRVAEVSRPDLAVARASVQQSLAEQRVTHSAGLPQISLGSSLGYNAAITSGSNSHSATLNLGFSYPFFTGGAQQNQELAAASQTEATRARAELTRQQIDLEVATSYDAMQTSTRRVNTSIELLTGATASEAVALGRYREGVGSILELLTAQAALADARSQAIQARWQWREALATLAHDVGILDLRGGAPLPLRPTPPPSL